MLRIIKHTLTLVLASAFDDKFNAVSSRLARSKICRGGPCIGSAVFDTVGNGAGNDTIGRRALAKEKRHLALGAWLPSDSESLTSRDNRVESRLRDGISRRRIALRLGVCGDERGHGSEAGGEKCKCRHFGNYCFRR